MAGETYPVSRAELDIDSHLEKYKKPSKTLAKTVELHIPNFESFGLFSSKGYMNHVGIIAHQKVQTRTLQIIGF